ncbi:MAG: hypothetical protein ABIU05_06085 [Nitrospirales bacterium]
MGPTPVLYFPPPTICCPLTYRAGVREGHGLAWNLSANGWRFSGEVPLRVGQTSHLTINVPDQHPLFVAAVTVRWDRGQEYGGENVVVEKPAHTRVEHWVTDLAKESMGSIQGAMTVPSVNHDHRESDHLQHDGQAESRRT